MNINLFSLLHDHPTLLLFLVILLGVAAGNLRFWGFQFGSTTGVLVAGLIFGHMQLTAPPTFEEIGFILFIYCVGLAAGPQFFNVFRKEGAKYILLALVTGLTGFGLAYYFSRFLYFGPGSSAGMLAGALTSTPTLVAAQDAILSGMTPLGEGVTIEMAKSNITTSYAITYLFGLIGLVFFVSFIPKLFRIDLQKETQNLLKERNFSLSEQDYSMVKEDRDVVIRVYKVTNDKMIGVTLEDLDFHQRTGCVIQKIKRGEAFVEAGPETELVEGDVVALVGDIQAHSRMPRLLGPEILDRSLLDFGMESWSVVVASNHVVGKSIQELDIRETYHCILTQVSRSGITLPLSEDLKLQKGDTLRITGSQSDLKRMARKFGHTENSDNQTDMVSFGLGICLGIVLGTITFQLGTFSLSLGTAGGCLFSGLIMGYLRSSNPTIGRVPSAARNILMELGLLFFMANVGLSAGKDILATLKTQGPLLFSCGAAVTISSALVAFITGKYFLKLNPVLLLGAITGAMTSTPSLSVVTKQAKNPLPTLGYAGTYAFATVILAISGGILARF